MPTHWLRFYPPSPRYLLMVYVALNNHALSPKAELSNTIHVLMLHDTVEAV